MVLSLACRSCRHHIQQYHHESSSPRYSQRASSKAMHFRSTYCSSQVLTQHIHNKTKTGKAQRASLAQEELQESKLTKAGGRKPTHGCNYPMVGWPSVILTPVGPSLNLFFWNLQDQKVQRYFGSSQLGTSRNQPLCSTPEMSNTRYHSLPDAGQTRQMARRGSNMPPH